jgi:outer membrane protein OmpA-like peptidoglycan-associated protein
MPSAQKQLADVAKALQKDERSIVVVGHTDATGDDEKNMQLSQKRADAVSKFLTTHGVSEQRVRTEGMGERQPVADNKSPEGRANNRRVEVILERPQGGMQNMPSTPTP